VITVCEVLGKTERVPQAIAGPFYPNSWAEKTPSIRNIAKNKGELSYIRKGETEIIYNLKFI
jgi:hypothetical protein